VTVDARLATGAGIRFSGPPDGLVVLCVDGGTGRERPGTWSASVEHVVRNAVPRVPEVGWAEVRYRVRSWRQIDRCIEDAAAALDAVASRGATRIVMLGYSMGAIVSCAAAGHGLVRHVIGLAPWLPERVDVSGMHGRHFTVFHGSLDRNLPGIPGVHPDSSRQGLRRVLAAGATGSHTLIPGAVHPIALRAPWGGRVPMPRADAWVRSVVETVTSIAAGASPHDGETRLA
jgi:dienelactone hydrolase